MTSRETKERGLGGGQGWGRDSYRERKDVCVPEREVGLTRWLGGGG